MNDVKHLDILQAGWFGQFSLAVAVLQKNLKMACNRPIAFFIEAKF
jgi:hypothetical protein